MSEAPAEVWLRPGPTWDSYYTTAFPDQPDAVRYVRAGHEMARERAMSEAPAEMWVRSDFDICRSAPFADAVRYVRADLHEALVVRANQEPRGALGTDYP